MSEWIDRFRPPVQCCHFGLVQPWTTRSKVGPMSPSVVQGRPFCGGLEWSKANFGRAGPGPRWDLAWRSANLEKFRLRRSFARGPAPSTPVLEESLDFEARRGKKEGFFYPHFIWSYVVQCWSYVASPTPSKMVQCASKCEIAALLRHQGGFASFLALGFASFLALAISRKTSKCV